LSGDKRFSANTDFSYKDFYYEIIKFTKMLSDVEVRQLLMAWDRWGIPIFPHLDTTDFS